MRNVLIVLSVVWSTTSARPEAGYNYATPNRGFNSGGIVNFGSVSGGYATGSGGGIAQQQPQQQQGGFIASNFGSSSGSVGYTGGASTINSGAQQGFASNSIGFSAANSGFASGSAGFGQQGFGQQGFGGQQQTIVQKHIYVHVPPPEPEEVRQQINLGGGVAQKHYKIIFIKAPSAPSPAAIQLAQAAQNQEKTIVYVLVKKPDDIGDINVQQAIAAPPSKPEVYFIKYKTHKEEGTGGSIGINTANSGSAIGSGSAISSQSIAANQYRGSTGQSSSANIQINTSGSAVSVGVPAPVYGTPGQSGPY